MSKFTVIFVCLALAQIAYSLKCYHCDGDRNKCENVEGLTLIPCGKETGALKPACEKVIHRNKASKALNITRRCALVKDQNDNSQCPTVPNGFEQVECSTCFDDGCNTASSLHLNLFSILGLVGAFFFAKFVIH